jgi:hypothetical protein
MFTASPFIIVQYVVGGYGKISKIAEGLKLNLEAFQLRIPLV